MTNADPDNDNGLIFPWKPRPISAWRLLPPLLACLGVLALLALVFKVGEPAAAPRASQGSRGILLLDPANPISQGLLNRAMDRGVLLLESQEEGAAKDRDLMPLFEPSFAGFEVRLKDPVTTPAETPRYRLFQADDLALPPLPPAAAAPRPPVGAARSYRLAAVFRGDLASAALAAAPALSHLRPQDLARLRFQLGVQANGRVEVVIPLTSSLEDRDLLPALQSALTQTRFAPEPGAGLRWGEVSFLWQSVSQPAGS